MLYSMTGYAQCRRTLPDGRNLTVTVRSVNHRFMELQISLPDLLASLESDIRQLTAAYLSRGKVNITARLQGGPMVTGGLLNSSYIRAVAEDWQDLFPDEPIPGSLLLLPESMKQDTSDLSEESSEIVLASVESALEEVLEVRAEEASRLLPDLLHQLKEIEAVLERLEDEVENLVPTIMNELRERLDELIGEEVSEERIVTEAGLLSMRMDIREEMVRARRFVESMGTMLSEPSTPVGKELNFFTQELHRELNTMGQKLKDVDTRELVVKAKLANEKFREQIQNIE